MMRAARNGKADPARENLPPGPSPGPYPELVEIKRGTVPWVYTTAPSPVVDLAARVLGLPADYRLSGEHDDYARFAAAHELGHVRHTPKHAKRRALRGGISGQSINVAEDAFVNSRLSRVLPWFNRAEESIAGRIIGDMSAAIIAGKSRPLSVYDAICMLVAGSGAAWGRGWWEFRGSARESARMCVAPEDEELFDAALRVVAEGRFHGGSRRLSPRASRGWVEKLARFLDSLRPASGSAVAEDHHGKKPEDRKVGVFRWGRSEWSRLRPSHPARGSARLGTGIRWREEGSGRRIAASRLLDGTIFGERRRGEAVSVLVDMSGSMDVSTAEITALVSEVGRGRDIQVVGYSGRGTRGGLVWLARRGKVVSESELLGAREFYGFGNVIDGPALEWLGSQRGRRVWVSDGEATGENEGGLGIARVKAELLRRRIGAVRASCLPEALRILKGGRRV